MKVIENLNFKNLLKKTGFSFLSSFYRAVLKIAILVLIKWANYFIETKSKRFLKYL